MEQKEVSHISDEIIEEEEEQDEEEVEELSEQEQDEEQDEQAIKLRDKIDKLDERIEQHYSSLIENRKIEAMKRYKYSDEQIEKYSTFIEGETIDEIRHSVIKLSDDIPPADEKYLGDPSLNNGATSKPRMRDARDVAEEVFQRVKQRIRW